LHCLIIPYQGGKVEFMLLVLKLYLILPYHLTTLYSRVGETSKSERFRKELWWVVRLQTHTHTHLPACLPLNVALPCVTLENTWTMRGRLVNSIMIQSFLKPSSAASELQMSVCTFFFICTQTLQYTSALGQIYTPSEPELQRVCRV